MCKYGAMRTNKNDVLQCDAINGGLPTYTWKIRLSFLVYIIAVVTTIGELVTTQDSKTPCSMQCAQYSNVFL